MHFQRPKSKNDDERILPLINVVFLLLIFFMITGKLTPPEPFDIDPAQSASKQPAEPAVRIILIDASGKIALNGEILDETAFKAAITTLFSSKISASQPIRLKADGRTQAKHVVEVMEWLRAAGATKLLLLTVPTQL